MKMMLVLILAGVIAATSFQESKAENGAFFDSVKFIQYLDENTALQEVRNGNLDIYYDTISSDRLETSEDREGLQVYDSTSRFYSILVNPAESEKFNPFSDRDVRFAINYLVDRNLIVNELMGGYGSPSISYYGNTSPEFLTIIEQLEEFNFKYNPALAEKIISEALVEAGAIKSDGIWEYEGIPIEITIFIRNDDPIRKSIGEILASELEEIGFTVAKDFGDLNKAFVVVYGSNPADLKWNLYTEAWQRSAFVKYDSTGLGQMYSPWFSNMPGFNDPTYWNYENAELDTITQKIYTSEFASPEQRAELVQQAAVIGIDESVRIFLANKIDQYVVNEKISGIVNDFGAGVPSRFTPINAQSDHAELVIGVNQIYQGAWNPVMGMTDSYSVQIWDILSDPPTFKHPFTGETIPIRAQWQVDTAGPDKKLEVPSDAKIWNTTLQKWSNVDADQSATSKVTFDVKLGNWHNGQKMDINDIVYSSYFGAEWGTQDDEDDKTFDTEFTPRAAQSIQTIKGIKPIDEDTIIVYVDYWHFDEGEIASWAAIATPVPWEITAAMEKAVLDGKVSFSRSGAVSKNVNWLSLIISNDATIIKEYLQEFRDTSYIPKALKGNNDIQYYLDRYDASINWIEKTNHAVISNGPFYLKGYMPESRTIKVNVFEDESYPFKKGAWSEFEEIEFPEITKVKFKDIISSVETVNIEIETVNSDAILYFLTDSKGEKIVSDRLEIKKDNNIINIDSRYTENLDKGANSIKIFAISDSVLKPDFYKSSFIVTQDPIKLPDITYKDVKFLEDEPPYELIVIPILIIAGIVTYLKKIK